MAETYLGNQNRYHSWKLIHANADSLASDEIPIIAHRIPEVPGKHAIKATSNIDTITVQHEAHSRDGFGLGAIIAAEWVLGKKGIFTIQDVLPLNH